MSHPTYFMGFYWGSRQVDIPSFTRSMYLILDELGRLRDDWKKWYWVTGSKTNLDPFHPELSLTAERIEACANRRDSDKKIISELGRSFSLWTGQQEDEVSSVMRVAVGVTSPRVTNSFTISFPSGAGQVTMLSISLITQMFSILVPRLDPDWGIFTSRQLRSVAPKGPAKDQTLGLMNYLSNIPQVVYESGRLQELGCSLVPIMGVRSPLIQLSSSIPSLLSDEEMAQKISEVAQALHQ